jgi:hypothetical protein
MTIHIPMFVFWMLLGFVVGAIAAASFFIATWESEEDGRMFMLAFGNESGKWTVKTETHE